jgi:hypothetical protein
MDEELGMETCVAKEPNVLQRMYWRLKDMFRKRGPSNLELHALREFKAAGYKPIEECEDDPNKWIQENVLELLRTFSKQGHSGFSAPYCINMFQKLARFEPLVPLWGDESEWSDVSDRGGRDDGPIFQNKRCSHVFKDANGAYDIDGVVFEEPDGCRFTGFYSRVSVSFPYSPKTVIAYVPKDATDEQKIAAAALALTPEVAVKAAS